MNQDYVDTVRLLLAIAPAVFRPPRFALKGGTARYHPARPRYRRALRQQTRRRVHEVLFPRQLPLEPAFTNEFSGMTRDGVALTLLKQTQERLIAQLPRELSSAHRSFLLSPVSADP
jgi:hypothetical protein